MIIISYLTICKNLNTADIQYCNMRRVVQPLTRRAENGPPKEKNRRNAKRKTEGRNPWENIPYDGNKEEKKTQNEISIHK